MKRRVSLPQSNLSRQLAQARRLQAGMQDQLRQLEAAAGASHRRPLGWWRHHPLDWLSGTDQSSPDSPSEPRR